MVNRRVLLVVASGKSSRFGGFPKAFCDIGDGLCNAQNTINCAEGLFDKIYVALNEDTINKYQNGLIGCEVFSIQTGHGDAHSLLRDLWILKDKEPELQGIYFCWGDAVFTNKAPLEEFVREVGKAEPMVGVACAFDKKPYAWFDIDKGLISKSHFASDEPSPREGLHDQSLFYLNIDFAVNSLAAYRDKLKIKEDLSDIDHIPEMKFLYWLEDIYNDSLSPSAQVIRISRGNVNSFNTQDELDVIKEYFRNIKIGIDRRRKC